MRKIDIKLLEEYLKGVCTEEESKRIRKWLEEKETWPKEATGFCTVKKFLKKKQLWLCINSKIKRTQQKKLNAQINTWQIRYLTYVIASAVLLFFILYPLKFQKIYNTKEYVTLLRVKLNNEPIQTQSAQFFAFPNLRQKVYYQLTPNSSVKIKEQGGNLLVYSSVESIIKMSIDNFVFKEFVVNPGQFYVMIYTGADRFLRVQGNMMLLPVDELLTLPPHDAIKWTRDQLYSILQGNNINSEMLAKSFI